MRSQPGNTTKRTIADDDDDGLFDDNDDDDSEDQAAAKPSKASKKRKTDSTANTKKKKKQKNNWIDDAAEESGEEDGGDDDDEDEEDDDDDNNDYVKDGFVVDEDEEEEERRKKKSSGELEDSDDEEEEEDEEDANDDEDTKLKKKKAKKFRKIRELDVLAEEDLDLIREARGETERERLERERQEAARRKVVAQNEAELRKGLFYDSAGEEEETNKYSKHQQRRVVERYDEDGMDDFIDDDIGDQGEILASERRTAYEGADGGAGVSEAQLNEASEIFGTDYLEFMQEETREDEDESDLLGRKKYRERGVGVDLGVDSDVSDDDNLDEDDDDDGLFDDDSADGVKASQKAEALKLRRDKRELERKERRQQKLKLKNEKRKAQLRKAFEPVQLVENFCTDRDDEIRQKDVPERFFDWNVPFHGAKQGDLTPEEEEEALWIMSRIPAIRSEYTAPRATLDEMNDQEKSVTNSIAHALRYMHEEKLEPAFIKRYRKDVITSPAVRENLYAIMDEDAEWETMVNAKEKVDAVLDGITRDMQIVDAAGAQLESLQKLQQDLEVAEKKLDETVQQETEVKSQLEAMGPIDQDDDDDDEELFKDDDDEENEEKKIKREKRVTLEKHLATIQSLLQDRSEKVSELRNQLERARAQAEEGSGDRGPAIRVARKICREQLWNDEDLVDYLAGLTDVRHILDVHVYLNLIKEGNDAIRKKEMPLTIVDGKKGDTNQRSRRFDRDFYRTCVAEGHRDICYRFLLSPNRAGIKLEDFITEKKFDYAKMMPGEDAPHPQRWVAPTIQSQAPDEYASDLVGSGELVLLSSASGMDPDDAEARDPLRGCRYVAAMELAHEPRIRRHLRNIYRRHAVLTTRPTKKGMDVIDAFHDFFGLHLIKDKPVKEHFPMDESESAERRAGLSPEECNELDAEMKRRERESCLQFLNIIKAEKTGHLHVHIHLPLAEAYDEWYAQGDIYTSRDKQDIKGLMEELEKVYFPMDGDSEAWNDERRKVLTQALLVFLLPQFESETRRDLREAAVKVGVMAAGENLHVVAMEGPYRPHSLLHTENRFLHPTDDLPIVGICCSSDVKEAMYLASVTEQGELQDHLAIPGGARIDSDKYREKVIKFLIQARPAAVLIGTSGGFDSRLLCRKVNDLINEAVKRWENRGIQGEDEEDDEFEARQEEFRQMMPRAQFNDDEYDRLEWTCNVDLVDDSVSQLFGRSVRGKKEFPELETNLKIAISTARYGKNPLAELTYSWCVASDTGNFGAELLYINVHPLQQLLPSYMLLRQYERILCEVVSEVGVDMNAACKYDHLHGLLTFVPGLGPRKAANLKQNIVQLGGAVGSRRSLLEKRLMGPVVYNNAVAFLRIRETEQVFDQLIHPLDDTRLHPDVYHRNNWAAKIATDALERAEGDGRNRELAGIKALRDVMDNSAQEVERLYNATKEEWVERYGPTFNVADWDPKLNVPQEAWRDKVEELDLDTFAQMIEQNGLGRWHSHLQMIKWEFRLPFADPRKPMEALSGDKLFRLITGETDQSLRPGKEVTGKVIRNGDFGSRVKLEGDIPAFIPLRNLSDEHVETAEDIVTVGMVVTAIITEVKKDHMCVDMSLKMEDFRRPSNKWDRPQSLPPVDDHFDRSASAHIEEKKAKEREARLEGMRLTMSATRLGEDGDDAPKVRRGRVARRACAHPAFRNARNDEVNKELKEGGAAMVGEALIRPSSKAADSLAIHWVVREGCIKVIEVTEEDKDTDASVGNVLKVKDETYGSIDELMGRYIAPMNDYVEELINHRKFVDLPEDELDDRLRTEKNSNPNGVFYNVCWMEMHPGYASLRFILSATPRHHAIGISPNGFVWGSLTYSSLDLLLNDFKKNPRGASTAKRPVPPPASDRPQANPVKMEDGAAKPSRWGNKTQAPSAPWGQAPPPAPQAPGGWGSAPPVPAAPVTWGQPPPPGLPPPPGPYRPPPPARPPPPSFNRPPPAGPPPPPPPYQQNSQYQYQQPPPPPGYPPRLQ